MGHARTAVITGGGTGIGKAVALDLARAGYDVLIAGRRAETLARSAQDIRAQVPGISVFTHTCDIGVPHQCQELIDVAIGEMNRIAVVVNAGAICESVHARDLEAAQWDASFNVNLRGSALVSAAAARHMRTEGGGRIVLFSSINGAISEPSSAAYSATKAGISSLARSMAVDLAGDGIAVNAVAPGWIHTAMTADFLAQAGEDELRRLNPLGRLGRPEEIAGVVVYLAAAAPDFLTGSTIYVDGGQTAAAVMP